MGAAGGDFRGGRSGGSTAPEHGDLLASAGLEKDFLKKFAAEARELALVARRQAEAREQLAAATVQIPRKLKEGMTILTIMEGMVMAHHADAPSLIRAWRAARRVPGKVGRPKARRR